MSSPTPEPKGFYIGRLEFISLLCVLVMYLLRRKRPWPDNVRPMSVYKDRKGN